MIQILAIGDVVGTRTLEALHERLWKARTELHADLVVANGENATDIHGLCCRDAKLLLACGVDLITLGNHTYGMRDLHDFLDNNPESIIRPANYPSTAPGFGYAVRDVCGWRVLCINVNGTTFMEPLDSPFAAIEKILDREEGRYDIAVADLHAEATSEKLALARAFDGRLTVMFGTHTHVQTADEQILPHGSGYITDLGMSGPVDGILGTKTEAVLTKMRDHLPAHFTVAEGEIAICGALFTVDPSTKKCVAVARVKF
jgi:metallophosphoesterase (TIGR00282 family)